MTLYQAQQTNICTLTRKIQSMLFHREADWTKGKKELQTERIMIKMGKAKKEQELTKRLLESCKSWGGPCTTPNQIEITLNANPDKMEKIIKTELSYYRHTHKADMVASPELFKLIRVTHEERLENLCILLSDDHHIATCSSSSTINLPSNDDVFQVLQAALSTTNETGRFTCSSTQSENK